MKNKTAISPADGDEEQTGTPTGGEIEAPAEAPKKTVNITCQQCGEDFTANSRHAKFCPECRRQRYNAYKRGLYHRSPENREKQKIRAKTQSRRRSGKIVKAAKCCIEGCNETEGLTLHHWTYQGDFAPVAVLTLCQKHHLELHGKQLHEGGEK